MYYFNQFILKIMKKELLFFTIFYALLLLSCKQEVETPKVIYDDSKVTSIPKSDTTQIQVADLPIQFKGSRFLIHPIGDLSIHDRGLKSTYGASNRGSISFTISNFSDYEITGFLRNLKFQEVGSDSLVSLTNRTVLIQTATFLMSVANKTKQQVIVYTLADNDTNHDNKIDTNDIKTLYLSDSDGKRFTKFTPNLDELIDWNFIESNNRLYFRSIEDTNKNGAFDQKDSIHYSYIDLTTNEWKVTNYKPI